MIKEATNKLLKQEQIVEAELKEVFEEIFSGLANEVQTTSFLTALNNSNLSNEIIKGKSNSVFRKFRSRKINSNKLHI